MNYPMVHNRLKLWEGRKSPSRFSIGATSELKILAVSARSASGYHKIICFFILNFYY